METKETYTKAILREQKKIRKANIIYVNMMNTNNRDTAKSCIPVAYSVTYKAIVACLMHATTLPIYKKTD